MAIKVLSVFVALALCFILFKNEKPAELPEDNNDEILMSAKATLSNSFAENQFQLPDQFKLEDKTGVITYTFDEGLEDHIRKFLRRYFTAFSSIAVIDNDTGNVLALLDYTSKDKKFSRTMALSSTHPAASLFKIITAARLLETDSMEIDSKVKFRGKSTTLYKYQLKESKKNRRLWTLEKSFIYSNNVVFGKSAIKNLSATGLYQMATNFGFNKKLMDDVPLGISKFPYPENQYNLAELASGFNKETLISPLHAALLASTVARGGNYVNPKIIKEVSFQGKKIGRKNRVTKVYSQEIAKDMQSMMLKTVQKGTAVRVRARLNRKVRKAIDIGAKTGTITGGVPFGKKDWVTVYAKPKDGSDNGISVAVMLTNTKHWYIKSTQVAKYIINYYFKNKLK